MKQTAKVINVVSGKGGTGKSLLTAVLARAIAREGVNVLMIDFDVFVRGLTILLTESGRQPLQAPGVTVSDILKSSDTSGPSESSEASETQLAISRFFECDVAPAVKKIGDPFIFGEEQVQSLQASRAAVRRLIATIPDEYDLIFLDNRAGLDSYFLASCEEAHIVLSVAEDDAVALQANANLINSLRYTQRIQGDVYTVTNKARRIYSYDDLTSPRFRQVEFNYVGVIPFDSEVMEEFGTERFWSTVNETLYFRAVIDAWNNLARQEQLKEISESKYRFPPRIFMAPRAGRYTLIERMMIVYGILAVLAGASLWLYPRVTGSGLSSFDLYSMLAVLLGVLILLFPVLGFRRLLAGPKYPSD